MPSPFTDAAALGLIGYPINYTTRQQRRGRASLPPSLPNVMQQPNATRGNPRNKHGSQEVSVMGLG